MHSSQSASWSSSFASRSRRCCRATADEGILSFGLNFFLPFLKGCTGGRPPLNEASVRPSIRLTIVGSTSPPPPYPSFMGIDIHMGV